MKKNRFDVYVAKGAARLVFYGCAVFTIIPVLYTLFDGVQHPVNYILFAMLVIPFLLGGIFMTVFRVTVKDEVITVRRGIGTKYSISCSDITKVIRKVNHVRMGTLGKITVKTKSHKFSVESIMVGVDKMDTFIQENVDSNIIVTKEINWNKGTK